MLFYCSMVEKEIKVSEVFIEQIIEVITNLHETIIVQSGGEKGIRDKGGLYNSIYKILYFQEKQADDPVSVSAFVYKELARRHHFNDGNKRTAHVFAKIILFIMGFHFKIEYKDAVYFIIKIAEYGSIVTFNEIKDWLKPHVMEIPEKDIGKYIKKLVLEVTDEVKIN
jgi:death-on-curing family protein